MVSTSSSADAGGDGGEPPMSLKRAADLAAQVALPWVEKYRPEGLEDLVAQDDIVSVLNTLIESNRLPHLLFYGPPGTGKTSTILACAKKLYGKGSNSMVLELNASDDRGIDVVRNQIKEFAGTKRLFSSGIKLVILDEADAMTSEAQFSLRRVIEKYTKHTRFCLICNYVNKIIPALQSRCTKFRFAPLKATHIMGRLQHVIDAEKVTITPEGKDAIIKLGQGDMRRVINLLQCASMAYEKVDEENTYLCAAAPLARDVDKIVDWLFNSSFKEAFEGIQAMTVSMGYALNDILQDLTLRIMDIELPPLVLAELLSGLSDVEHRLSYGSDDSLQLGAVVGGFCLARAAMAPPGSKK